MKLSIITLACFAVGSSLAFAALRPVTASASTRQAPAMARELPSVEAPAVIVVPEITLVGTLERWHTTKHPHVAEVCPVERRELVTCGPWVDGIQRCDAVACRAAN